MDQKMLKYVNKICWINRLLQKLVICIKYIKIKYVVLYHLEIDINLEQDKIVHHCKVDKLIKVQQANLTIFFLLKNWFLNCNNLHKIYQIQH